MEYKLKMHLLETENIGDIVGLLEILEDLGRPVDIATLDDSLGAERTTLLNLLNDAEALGLVNVQNGDVSLTRYGIDFLTSDITDRKVKLRKILLDIEPFSSLIRVIVSGESKEIDREVLEEFIAENFPSDDPGTTFRLILNWGRYSRLFDYDPDEELLTYID